VDQAGLDELLRRARRRDPDALRELVAAYSPRVFGLLYRLTGSRDAAEDLLQETFLRVVRAIDQYEHVGKFESWLFRIAANLARDRARKIGRRGESDGLADDALNEMASTDARTTSRGPDNPAARSMKRAAGQRLAECLERLPTADREIIVLRHYSELSFREIADMLGVPLGTALARAHRALKRLREELTEAEE
jgi:RNA polymerase sigma-70 factor (ECF subfamily)